MYQMTLFVKKIFLGEYAPKRAKSLIKGMASLACVYVQRISLTHANLQIQQLYNKKIIHI